VPVDRSGARYDLSYDPNEVGADLVVEHRFRQDPRSAYPAFDPPQRVTP